MDKTQIQYQISGHPIKLDFAYEKRIISRAVFPFSPKLHDAYLGSHEQPLPASPYPGVCLLMLIIGVLMLLGFKRKNWF
jgi:hypothetical protein